MIVLVKDLRVQDTVLTWDLSIYLRSETIRSHFSKSWIHVLTELRGIIGIWHHKEHENTFFTLNILETSALYHTSFYGDPFSSDLGLNSATGCIVEQWG